MRNIVCLFQHVCPALIAENAPAAISGAQSKAERDAEYGHSEVIFTGATITQKNDIATVALLVSQRHREIFGGLHCEASKWRVLILPNVIVVKPAFRVTFANNVHHIVVALEWFAL
jgi:hypothetical protein